MESIQDLVGKIKSTRGLKGLILLVFLGYIILTVTGFILGRLSAKNTSSSRNDIKIEYPPLVKQYKTQKGAINAQIDLNNGQYVASVSGVKYYKLDCGGVSRIKEENKTYFNSAKEAENAGYEPAANCF